MGKNAYVMFVNGAGGTEFFRRYGRKPDITKDNRLTGALYQEISEDDRSYYKMLAKGVALPPRPIVFKSAGVSGTSYDRTTGTNAHANDPAASKFKRNSPSSEDSFLWRNPEVGGSNKSRSASSTTDDRKDGRPKEISDEDSLHFKNLDKRNVDVTQRLIVFTRATSDSISSGLSRMMLSDGRQENEFRQDAGRQEKPVVRRTSAVKPPNNPFAKFSVDLHKFQFISIYNYVYYGNQNNTKTVYPAEIAVISFSLKRGVFEKDVIRVNFSLRDENDNLVDRSKREFFNGYPNETVEEKLHTTYEERKACAGYVKNVGCSFKDALLWLYDKLHNRPGRINVLDPNSETRNTIYHMFEVNGSFSQKKKIDSIRFYSFDDIIPMIMESFCLRAVSTFDISNYFTKQHTFNQTQICCPDHKDPNRTVHGFFFCPVFAALCKIQMFFDFCDDVGVCGFSRRSVQNIHDYVFFYEHRMSPNRSKIGLQLNDPGTLSQAEYMSSENCETVEKLRFRVMDDEEWDEYFTLNQVPNYY